MHQLIRRQASTVAFIAACVLVLQSCLGALAAGAMASAPMLDVYGNPLCVTGGHHHDTAPPNDHSRLPNCCILGCSTPSPLLAASPADSAWLRRLPYSNDVSFEFVHPFHIPAPDHDPGSPRAPPLTV